MEKIMLAVPRRLAAQQEMPALLQEGRAGLYVFPEGFLRSEEDVAMALGISVKLTGTILTGYRDGDEEKVLVIESGRVRDGYTKCVLHASEKQHGKRPGDKIRCVDTRLGKIAVPICYELHFPEACRLMALERPVLMVNPIGTGMYHQQQYRQWRALARARAIENEMPVVGCCHFCGEIPLAFAFDSAGESCLETRGEYGAFTVEVDLEQAANRPLGYFADRVPRLFGGWGKAEPIGWVGGENDAGRFPYGGLGADSPAGCQGTRPCVGPDGQYVLCPAGHGGGGP